ncbi:MAG: gliding motility-associated C-terminal domain-containing protein [Saprospiraceae bacterium]|uniref:Gliding motility-associated C-terminal domain-containing protein n=1 Tax=Candidatus Opimibacter skivensis TaxID=2982028 RepID=A0A9D7SXF3_9BACT|nr:gliding motility-associated C-terminal domain-containing protein [Candidatus Opimibacter skivensis]
MIKNYFQVKYYSKAFNLNYWNGAYLSIFPLVFTFFFFNGKLFCQDYYNPSLLTLYKININNSFCECNVQPIGLTDGYDGGISFGPDGNLYYLNTTTNQILQVDILTGNTSIVFTGQATLPHMAGFISVGNGIFYSMGWYLNLSDTLYRWNINSGIVTAIGSTGFRSLSEMTIAGGEIYYLTKDAVPFTYSIVQLDTLTPGNSQVVLTYPLFDELTGISATPFCNTLIGSHVNTDELVLVNLIDGAITPVCYVGNAIGFFISSPLEFAPPPPCVTTLDLDCNDSSGATNADYNSPDYNCLSNGVGIADEDIRMFYDAIISEMTIQITGFVPDVPFELLSMTGSVAGINVSGSGTDMITLSNAGGAKSTDFKDALRLVVYNNISNYPTGGLRTVEVQFTTESGAMSNVATAFIQVNELARVPVDLGPDQQQCDGLTTTFDAGNPGANYNWSTGQHSQTITTGTSGQYIVTVSNGILCPNQDTVELDIIPVIHVSLTGETDICDNEQANMTIENDSPFPMTIEITPDPGSPFTLTDVEGNYTFFDLPGGSTVYTITSIIPSQPACIEMTDSTQAIFVFPTYITNVVESICDGDSIWLGYYWENQAGQYEILFYSIDGCDSTVNFTIDVSPAVNISAQATTCIPAEAGVFITHLNNPTGCDTVVHTTVTFLPSDTTSISLASCNSSNVGVFTQLLQNQDGCDSLVITTVTLTPPQDTTIILQTTCDSSLLGVTQQLLVDQSGCDSLVITSITMAPTDTSYLSSISCDSAAIGIFQLMYSGQDGCDSFVITTVSAGIPDTTYTNTTSCDSSSLGVFEMHFNSQAGCDSTVFTTISYSASDSISVVSSSCDPADVGTFTQSYINRFGCDSIVTTTVSLSLSEQTFINSTTCDPSAAGVFIHTLTNQFGCDSIVTETIDLLASSETFLFSNTCMSSQAGVFITTLTNQNGCDSIVTLTVSLIPADTTIISFSTCDPAQVGINQNTFTNQDGCDSLVIEQTTLYPLPDLQVQVTSDFNGYDISCFGEADGSAIANVSGVSPYSYIWSTGSTDQSITDLSSGLYTVTITDANGCKTDGKITLSDPGPFMISFVVSNPDCFDQHNGSITVEQIGGVLPVRYSIDEINYQSSPSFKGLSGGTYHITARDANDCEKKEIIFINVPLMVNVELGDDQIIEAGDTVLINAIVNVPFDSLASIIWTGLTNPNCPTCLTQPVVPIVTTTYSVSVISVDGCKDEDALTIFLEKNTDIYVPNIFSPNGDIINDKLIISAGSDVEEISSLIIFDRWGNMVFSRDHFQANDPNNAWDGRLKGRELNSAVFAYRLIAKFKDGSQFIREGDVTLLK